MMEWIFSQPIIVSAILVLLGLIAVLYTLYTIVRVTVYGAVKSYFDAKIAYNRKKGDLCQHKENQEKK